MAKIFITGITGFLGSNIARQLILAGHEVIATYRSTSSKRNCADFEQQIKWVLQDTVDWPEEVIQLTPQIVIHAAWLGVSHQERNNWESQFKNIVYLNNILSIAQNSGSVKFIGLGSQAEYGLFNSCIDEQVPLNPTEAYGNVKVISSELVKRFCQFHQIEWYWLRLFSFFGRGENDNWLIPSLVKKMLTEVEMDFTAGEQRYAYLYADDLGTAINHIISARVDQSGIYNISGKRLIQLKQLIKEIRDKINPNFKLNFGKLPYRLNQSMLMQGNSSKFRNAFGEFELSDFDVSLQNTLIYLDQHFTNKSTHEGI